MEFGEAHLMVNFQNDIDEKESSHGDISQNPTLINTSTKLYNIINSIYLLTSVQFCGTWHCEPPPPLPFRLPCILFIHM
jgi:hypothetical protein